jgi:OPA family glycerol-3-phosphate transporter-like MFS transporter
MNKTKQPIIGKKLAWLLMFLYFVSYMTRINYAAIIQEIVTATGFAKSSLSVVLVAVSITYGVGQVINGKIGDHVKPQNLILCGLVCTSVVNLLLPLFAFSVTGMVILWGINGFAQAMMWPPIVKILVANTDDATYGYSVVRVSWGSSFGTILVYLTAPLIITLLGWKAVFYLSAGIGFAASVLWFLLKSRVPCEDKPLQASADSTETPKFHFPKEAVFPMVFIVLGIIFQGMLRDGVTSWMPTYLAEVFQFGNQTSIFCTVSLAIFSIITFSAVGTLYKKYFRNEVACAGGVYAVSVLAAGLLFLFFEGGAIVAILLMALITGCMHGINLMLITHVPKRFKKFGNISTISGAINACTYVGAAISTYGISLLSETIGWRNTVGVWFIIAALGGVCCVIAMKPWKRMI